MAENPQESLSAFDAAIAALSAEQGVDEASPFISDDPEPETAKAPTSERKRRINSRKRRTTKKAEPSQAEDLLAGIRGVATVAWGSTGLKLAMSGNEQITPVGVMMQYQAPAAGKHIANIADKTPIVNWLAPLFAGGTAGLAKEILALVMPPLIVGMMANNPVMQEKLGPMLGLIMVPLAKDIVEAQEEQADVMGIMSEQDEKTAELVQTMMANIFGAKQEQTE